MDWRTARSAVDARQNEMMALCLVDCRGRILAADAACRDWLGISAGMTAELASLFDAEKVGTALGQIAAGDAEATFDASLTLDPLGEAPVQVSLRRLDGVETWVVVTLHRGAPGGKTDALTGLPDRRSIMDCVHAWERLSGNSSARYAVLFADLDGFKRVNDECGHAVGDRALVAVAQRLVDCVREGDLVARYGGDEFVLLLNGVTSLADAEPVVERLKHCCDEPLQAGGRRLHLGVTIGVAVADGQRTVEELIDAADRDMYARKRGGAK